MSLSAVTFSFSVPYKLMGNPQASRTHKGLRHTHPLPAKQHREHRRMCIYLETTLRYKGRSAERKRHTHGPRIHAGSETHEVTETPL